MSADERMSSVVVTGASGFIGRAVVADLRARKAEFIALSRHDVSLGEGIETIRVASYKEFAFPTAAAVIHLAGEARIVEANRAGATHIAAERELAEAICASGARKIVYASSAQVYGDTDTGPHHPDDPAVNTTPYAEAKKTVEGIVCESGGTVARLSNVYGLGMTSTLIADILEQIPGTGPLRLMEAESRRDFLWLADAARGLVDMAMGQASGIYNLASGKTWSAAEVGRLALRLAGEWNRELDVVRRHERPSVISLDIGRTTEAFGWRPEIELETGIKLLLKRRANERPGGDT